jgi:hypothetical protein
MSRTLLFVIVALLAACGRSEHANVVKQRASAEHALARVPADANAIVAGSLVELATWPLWRRAVGVITHEAPGIAEQITSRCKLDPWTLIDNAALMFTGDDDGVLLAAETTVDKKRLHGCASEVASNLSLTIADGPITTYQHVDATEVAAWTGERLVLALPMRMEDADALRDALPERGVPALLQPLLERVEHDATVWGAALATGDGAVAELVAMMPLRTAPLGVHGSLRRGSGLRVQVALVFADNQAASEAVRLFESLLANPPPWLAPWRDAIRVETRGDEARVVLQLDAQRAQLLDDAVIALLPPPTERPKRPN